MRRVCAITDKPVEELRHKKGAANKVPNDRRRWEKQPSPVKHMPAVAKSPPASKWIKAKYVARMVRLGLSPGLLATGAAVVTSVPSAPAGQKQEMSKVQVVIGVISRNVTAALEWKRLSPH